MICNQCKDLGFVYEDGAKKVCVCTKFKQLYAYAPRLVKSLITMIEEDRNKFSALFDDSPNVFLHIKRGAAQNLVDTIILYWLLKHSQPSFAVYNVFELLEIYFHKHPKINSLFEIPIPAVVLLSGYEESGNKKTPEVILQVLEILRVNSSLCLYISVDTNVEAAINDYFKVHNWKRLDITSEASSGSSGSYIVR